jgi:hypothetical protein
MIPGIGLFDGGFTAPIVIHDNAKRLKDIVDGFNSVVAVAAWTPSGKLYFQLVSAKHPHVADLRPQYPGSLVLPLYITLAANDPPSDGPPEIIR